MNGLELSHSDLESKYAVSSTALNTSVVFLQSTMDHLMAKNDSVSYDMHIAAMDAMLDKLTETNAKVLANSANASSLVERQSETTGKLNATINTLKGDLTQNLNQLGTDFNSKLMQLQAALNGTVGKVDEAQLQVDDAQRQLQDQERQLQDQAAGAAAQEGNIAAINTSVVFLQSTVDHLMAKNDSVSYDMHIAAMDAMLDKLTETNAKVLANSDATVTLGTALRADFETLKEATDGSLEALGTRATTHRSLLPLFHYLENAAGVHGTSSVPPAPLSSSSSLARSSWQQASSFMLTCAIPMMFHSLS